MSRRFPAVLLLVIAVVIALVAAACGGSSKSGALVTVHLGYFPNVTHATAIVGIERGIFARALGTDHLGTSTFNAGPAAIEALLTGSLDATYVGPNPAINAFVKSHGAVRIVAGATSGGAALVVKPSITDPSELKGQKLASPQLGGTQDVALRYWLSKQGFKTDTEGGGDVSIVPQENSQTLETFKTGAIAGAWVPEPWASRLVDEGGGGVLVDEASLWPGGRFVTTVLLVRTDFLRGHPDAVERLLQGQVEANDYVQQHPADSQRVVNAAIGRLTGKTLKPAVVADAWSHLTFTDDPVATSLHAAADHAVQVGLLAKPNLVGMFDLTLLDKVLNKAGEKEVVAR
ncbi:MAG: ABC transporter substrate-binding protein [Actinobacteria bacterium]|nr:MAG: ABC transporter substrate-binding protein [Actinomycetota bacterium]